jgi:hypothetical protein
VIAPFHPRCLRAPVVIGSRDSDSLFNSQIANEADAIPDPVIDRDAFNSRDANEADKGE